MPAKREKDDGPFAARSVPYGLLGRIWAGLKHGWLLIAGKAEALSQSAEMKEHAGVLAFDDAVRRELLHSLRETLKQAEAGGKAGSAAESGDPAEAPGFGERPRPEEERRLVLRIREETARHNRNNVTRAAAYLRIYAQFPELHWAFLAHMVSRNAGWSMTDLKGELLPRLLGESQREATYGFLERANALIFQDAYPQLLLYAESRRLGKPLFRLLDDLHVSRFMRPFWELFWKRQDPVPLTIGLIINEQNYIEGRVVQNGHYKQNVLDSLAFQTQAVMQLDQVVFPYGASGGEAVPAFAPNGWGGAGAAGGWGGAGAAGGWPGGAGGWPGGAGGWPGGVGGWHRPSPQERSPGSRSRFRLAGLVLENFADLNERIAFGKTLYAILFGIPEVYAGAHRFAFQTPHSGSRSDYWPHLFATMRVRPPERKYRERLAGCSLRDGAEPMYSPRLSDVWRDRPVDPPERYDWFRSSASFHHLSTPKSPFTLDMTNEACAGLTKIELAVLAAEALKP